MDRPATENNSDTPTRAPSALTAGKKPGAVALFLMVSLITLATDLGLKAYAFNTVAGAAVVIDPSDTQTQGVPHHAPTVLVPGVLNLQLTANAGAIFGMGKGSRWVFVVVSLAAALFICRVFWRSSARAGVFHVALALILAGAVGNLYDRVRFAAVRDMLHLFPVTDLPFGLTWPGGAKGLYPWVFNLADVALLLGVVTVILITWRSEPRPTTASTTEHG